VFVVACGDKTPSPSHPASAAPPLCDDLSRAAEAIASGTDVDFTLAGATSCAMEGGRYECDLPPDADAELRGCLAGWTTSDERWIRADGAVQAEIVGGAGKVSLSMSPRGTTPGDDAVPDLAPSDCEVLRALLDAAPSGFAEMRGEVLGSDAQATVYRATTSFPGIESKVIDRPDDADNVLCYLATASEVPSLDDGYRGWRATVDVCLDSPVWEPVPNADSERVVLPSGVSVTLGVIESGGQALLLLSVDAAPP
jgi:hypothetical protein